MTWLGNNWPQVVDLTIQHLYVTVPAVLLSAFVAVPLGRLAHTRPRLGQPVLTAASLLYAVPSLPLLIIIPAVIAIPLRSPATLVIALTLYGVAMLVRTAVDAFESVDGGVRDAAVAVGHTDRSLLWRVDLPLAAPVLLAGVRVVTASTIGLVTIGALVGIPSLGTLFTDGFQRGITGEVLTGLVVVVVLALVLDQLLVVLGWALTPWNHRAPTGATA
ncbi:osmoprotectant transport system permease protein [Nocardioides sp. YR527]|uniref:ABC transporter permease n=1 Tax=Nocardioides sp. YR527 TaxID=1881028 RepID=UPI0008844667|nr:ABC transporter permease subunit [Nocardioides sp. YR527]SDL32328.1 osmoprotectant transport system permease protein [Nocardioides sp. YR527]